MGDETEFPPSVTSPAFFLLLLFGALCLQQLRTLYYTVPRYCNYVTTYLLRIRPGGRRRRRRGWVVVVVPAFLLAAVCAANLLSARLARGARARLTRATLCFW